MASFPTIAPRLARALHQALGALGATLVFAAASSAFATPAAAAPVVNAHAKATTSTSKARASRKAAKGTAKASKHASAARASAKRTRHLSAAERRAERRAARRHTHGRARQHARAEGYTPQPSADLVSVPVVDLPELALAPAPGGAGTSTLTLITRSATSLLDGLVARARSRLGTRYVYGAADPESALDCSSFARYVMEALNIRLPRTANQQAQMGTPVPRDLTALRPGDLLTFGTPRHTSHVGIYLGQGRFIHASVRSGQVIETTINRNGSLFRRWLGARRLLAGAPDSLSASADETSGG